LLEISVLLLKKGRSSVIMVYTNKEKKENFSPNFLSYVSGVVQEVWNSITSKLKNHSLF